MGPDLKLAQEGLISLRRPVSKELERKRRLGHYAVFWKDGQVVYEGPDAPDPSEILSTERAPSPSPDSQE